MDERNDKKEEEFEISDDAELMEEVEIEAEEELTAAKLKELRTKLRASEEEKRQCLEDLQRTKADFLNSKRRLEEQFMRDKERANDKIVMELLTLSDTFDTAMNAEAWERVDKEWREGVEAMHAKLLSILRSCNLETINPVGKEFNPEEHEAVANIPVPDEAKVDTVMEVLQKGFKRNGFVIRPARVAVGTKGN